METMKVFENEQFGQVRTLLLDGEPWFVAADVCRALDVTNITQAVARLDVDERAMFNIGRQGVTNIINESGLYMLVLGSRKPEAKAFKRWVVRDVIPSIRKHGMYATPDTLDQLLTDPDNAIRLFTEIKRERAMREALEAKVTQDAPKVLFADCVETCPDSILIGSLAKILRQNGVEIGQNRLFGWLRANGFLCACRGERWNLPTQDAVDRGLFEVRERLIRIGGETTLKYTTKVTGKGQIYFIHRFLKEQGRGDGLCPAY